VGAKSRLVGTQEGAGKGVGGAREGGGRRGREEREAGLRERAVGGESNSTPRQRVVEGGERKTDGIEHGESGTHSHSARRLSPGLATDAVVVDLAPVDLLAGDGQHSAQRLEGCVTHGGVAVVERVLEVGLGALDGLEDVLTDLGLL